MVSVMKYFFLTCFLPVLVLVVQLYDHTLDIDLHHIGKHMH